MNMTDIFKLIKNYSKTTSTQLKDLEKFNVNKDANISKQLLLTKKKFNKLATMLNDLAFEMDG